MVAGLMLAQGEAPAFAVLPCSYPPPMTIPANNAQCDTANPEGHCFDGGYITYGQGKVSGTEASISRDNPGVFGSTSAWVMLDLNNAYDLAQVGWIKVSGSFLTGIPGETGTPLTSAPGYFYQIEYEPGSSGCLPSTALQQTGECIGQVFLNALPTTNLTDSDSYAVWSDGGQLEFQINNGTTLSTQFGTISVSKNCSNDNVPWVACSYADTSQWSSEMSEYGDEVPGSVSNPATFSGIAHLCPSGCSAPWVPDTQLSTSNFGTDDCHGNYNQVGTANSFTISDSRRTSSK